MMFVPHSKHLYASSIAILLLSSVPFLNRSCTVSSVSSIVQLSGVDDDANGGRACNGNCRSDSVMIIDMADSIGITTLLTVNK
jgi:hypothetical protein